MEDIDRASLRANVLERKKLDQLVSVYENSKKNLMSDMRKTQATYRRKLKAYRERKKEILISRSKNSDAALGDLLCEQLKVRDTISPKSDVKSLSSNGQSIVGTLSRQTTRVSGSSDADFEGRKIFKSNLSAYATKENGYLPNGIPAIDSGNKHQKLENKMVVSVEDVCKTSDAAGLRANSKHLLTVKAHPGRKSNPLSYVPSQLSAVTPDLPQTLASRLKPSTAPVYKVKHESEVRRAETSCFPSIQKHELREVEPGFEMPRSSSRQRSRLDLRPRTAWELLNANIVSDAGIQAGSWGKLQNNIIVYMDKDELQERGTFYNYLLRGRLEREHSRFASICHKVQDFCRSPGLFLVVKETTTPPSGMPVQRRSSSRRYSVTPSKNSISGIPTVKQH